MPEDDFRKVVWGKTYNGKKVYICTMDDEEFMVWVNGEWIGGVYAEYDDNEEYLTYADGNGTVYYKQNMKTN